MPATVAVDDPRPLAAPVTTVGAPCVVNVKFDPLDVPASLDATRRKLYVVPAFSPLIVAETLVGFEPEPALAFGVFDP